VNKEETKWMDRRIWVPLQRVEVRIFWISAAPWWWNFSAWILQKREENRGKRKKENYLIYRRTCV